MWHDAQAVLQDGSNDSHIGTMPKQTSVPQIIVNLEPITLLGDGGVEKKRSVNEESSPLPVQTAQPLELPTCLWEEDNGQAGLVGTIVLNCDSSATCRGANNCCFSTKRTPDATGTKLEKVTDCISGQGPAPRSTLSGR